MSKRDPLRPYMNIIDKMLVNMLSEDPTFKPQGGKLGGNEMDYDTDAKSMASLRRQLKKAREVYYRCKSEYMNFVTEALELEDIMKNYEHRSSTGWKYISSFRPERKGRFWSSLDVIELIWRCILRKQLEKLLAIILGCMSAAILIAEATILPSEVDLSLFSILINIVGKHEMVVQVAAFIPLIFQREESDDLDGFDPSGLIILQKERSWLQQGHKVGELVVPLARSFNNATIDLESSSHDHMVSLKTQASRFITEEGQSSHSEYLNNTISHTDVIQEGTIKPQAAMRSQSTRHEIDLNANEKESRSTSSYDAESNILQAKPSSGLASKWESMKTGFRNFKSRIEAKKFIPLRQVQDTLHSRVSSSESLDEIFERIGRPIAHDTSYVSDNDLDDDNAMAIYKPGRSR
ncbi:hypothetical protein DH2020_011076 [Rehmannia glutinosa]|uniref:Uncharacterized protein n=1 Tax=Rehmannia glutinosa TaxID=99300 RepID=A0ABR0XCD7_REHGL